MGSAVPETLLFALLWSVGGVLVAPYVRRVLGVSAPAQGRPPASPYGPPSPYAPPPYGYIPPQTPQSPQSPQPPQVHDLGIVQPDRLSKDEGARSDEGGGRHL